MSIAGNKNLNKKAINDFRRTVLEYFRKNGRATLPWRATTDPYSIAVSEIMLQQTQVPRVIEKYKAFLKAFPTVRSLAKAPLAKVLGLWSGLGYNRRAKYLHQMAKAIVDTHKGKFPQSIPDLEALPGIGHYTARAIASFAYNQPVSFIETNIRTVFIHHFFPGKKNIPDTKLMEYIYETLDHKNSRQWYSALMDYGTYLKQTGNTSHRNSKQYVKQKAFAGSKRQLRGAIIKSLLGSPKTLSVLSKEIERTPQDIEPVVADLMNEHMIEKHNNKYCLA
jgi:A/G-specific adenine glycosylase